MGYKKFNNNIFNYLHQLKNKTIELIIFIWAILEAGIWFIFPEFILTIFVAIKPDQIKKFVASAIIGTMVGTTIYFAFVSMNPELSYSLLLNTPFVSQKMIDHVGSLYEANEEKAALGQAYGKIVPVKVYTYGAVQANLNFLIYLIYVSISRLSRMIILSLVTYFIGRKLGKYVRNNILTLLILYAIIFLSTLYYVEGLLW